MSLGAVVDVEAKLCDSELMVVDFSCRRLVLALTGLVAILKSHLEEDRKSTSCGEPWRNTRTERT